MFKQILNEYTFTHVAKDDDGKILETITMNFTTDDGEFIEDIAEKFSRFLKGLGFGERVVDEVIRLEE